MGIFRIPSKLSPKNMANMHAAQIRVILNADEKTIIVPEIRTISNPARRNPNPKVVAWKNPFLGSGV